MRILFLFLHVLLTGKIESCTPFGRESLLVSPTMLGVSSSGSELSRPSVTNNNLFPSSVRARGEKNTHFVNGVAKSPKEMSVSLGASSSPSVLDASELNCSEFDESCRWRNVDGMFVDELDWYQGSGELDKERLAVATATNILPEGQYAIAATDMVQFPTVKAVLVSDQIACQIGDGEIRFMYWTSPEVQLKVCVKKMSKIYPDFDFCRVFSSSIEKNDPGPIFINIPEQGPVPFQIYIIADHFTFNSENLKGGFAIIDSFEYYARMCNAQEKASFDFRDVKGSDSVPLIPLAESKDQEEFDPHVTVKRESEFVSERLDAFAPLQFQLGVPKGGDASTGIVDFTPIPEGMAMNSKIKLRGPTPTTHVASNSVDEPEDVLISTVCETIVCSFNETEMCSNMAPQSDWSLSTGPVGNPLTGVRGDASSLPFNPEGSFAYIEGPEMKSRLQTPSFSVDKAVTIVFSYYKADKMSRLQAILKRENSEESVVYEAPKLTRNSRRWFRESLSISPGKYEYIAFEVSNLRANHYIGIDEMFVVDDRRKSFCFHRH